MEYGLMRRVAAVGVVSLVVVGILGASEPADSASSPGSGAGASVPMARLATPAPILPSGSTVIGATDGNAPLSVDISLKPRDQSALDAFIREISTPGSPEFRHYLSPGAFGPMFGPNAATIAAVRAWLSSTGLTVGATEPDGLLIPVSGTTRRVEQALGVSLIDTRLPSGREARNNTTTPVVPATLTGSLQGVIGLSTVVQPHSRIDSTGSSNSGAGGTLSTPKVGGDAVSAHARPTACSAANALHPAGYTTCLLYTSDAA